MQATAAVFVALLMLVVGCAADEPDEFEDPVEDPEAVLAEGDAEAVGTELTKESRMGTKTATRSRFPAGMIGYNRYYPSYSPEYYYPRNYQNYPNYPNYPNYQNYPSYQNYPNYQTYPNYYPQSNNYYPNYPPVSYPTSNYYPTGYSGYNPYENMPYGSGVNEYSAKHQRA